MAGGYSLAIPLGSNGSACNGSLLRISNSGPVASISTSASTSAAASSQFLGSYCCWPTASSYQRARLHSSSVVLVHVSKADAVTVPVRSWRRRRQSELQNVYRGMVISTSPPPLPSSGSLSLFPAGGSSHLCVKATFNVIESGGSMSIEEKNAIMEFEGLQEEQQEKHEEDREVSDKSKENTEPKEDRPGTPGTMLMGGSEEETLDDEEQEIYEPPAWKAGSGNERGAAIASVIALFVSLLDRQSADSDGKIIAGTGSVVLERVEEEVEKLRSVGNTQQQHLFEILRVVKLLQVDLQLIAASRKNSTLAERVNQAKLHCTQILNLLAIL